VAATTSVATAGRTYRNERGTATTVAVNTEYAAIPSATVNVTLTLTDSTIKGLPRVLAPGWHRLTLVDKSKHGRVLDVVKVVAAGYGIKQFRADLVRTDSDNPHVAAAAVSSVIAHAQPQGGTAARSSDGAHHGTFWVDLVGGRSYIFDNTPEEDGTENATLVTVSGSPTAAKAPKATASISTHEYGFTVIGLHRGRQLVHVLSTGTEAHMVFIIGVPAGTTKQQVSDALANNDPSFESHTVFGSTPMSHGGGFVAPLALQPGTYALVCFMPELKAGPMLGVPHFLKGMIRIIIVR
jgi:hypothetical protein